MRDELILAQKAEASSAPQLPPAAAPADSRAPGGRRPRRTVKGRCAAALFCSPVRPRRAASLPVAAVLDSLLHKDGRVERSKQLRRLALRRVSPCAAAVAACRTLFADKSELGCIPYGNGYRPIARWPDVHADELMKTQFQSCFATPRAERPSPIRWRTFAVPRCWRARAPAAWPTRSNCSASRRR